MKTVAYITDTHLDEPTPGKHGADAEKNWHSVLADLASRKIDLVVFGGDIGAYSAYPEFFRLLENYPLWVTPGNHDTSAQVRHFFPNLPYSESGFYHTFEQDHFKWFFLDSSTDKISPEQLQWFKKELQTEKELLIFVHHPILPVATAVDAKYPLENRDEIQELLRKNAKRATIFCGHYHVEDQVSDENLIQYVTPAVSYQIKKGTTEIESDASYFGYRIIEIDGSQIDTEVILLYPDEF